MKVFFDTEFTGLHQGAELISIGLIAEDGSTFYAESNEWSRRSIMTSDSAWIEENVLKNLQFADVFISSHIDTSQMYHMEMLGSLSEIVARLETWLSRLPGPVEMWSDCLAYDWVLFANLWDHALRIPGSVYYIPFDICTMFKIKGIDPDINREGFACLPDDPQKHNALWDARVIKACYEALKNEENVI